MTGKTREKELNALKAGIASLREEIAALAAGAKKPEEAKAAGPHAGGKRKAGKQGGPANGGHGNGAWTDFQHTFDGARDQGEKVARDLAAEIERHPLVGSMAAFGLGFIIAKLWYGKGKQ